MTDVFISYKRRLRARVEAIAAALSELGLRVWFDAALEPGNSFSAEISREVRTAACVLVCFSDDAFPHGGDENGWVLGEAMIGRTRRVLVATILEPTDLDPPWNTIHVEDLVAFDPANPSADRTSWRRVLAAIGRHVGRPGLAAYDHAMRQGSRDALKYWAEAFPDDPLAGPLLAEADSHGADSLAPSDGGEPGDQLDNTTAPPALADPPPLDEGHAILPDSPPSQVAEPDRTGSDVTAGSPTPLGVETPPAAPVHAAIAVISAGGPLPEPAPQANLDGGTLSPERDNEVPPPFAPRTPDAGAPASPVVSASPRAAVDGLLTGERRPPGADLRPSRRSNRPRALATVAAVLLLCAGTWWVVKSANGLLEWVADLPMPAQTGQSPPASASSAEPASSLPASSSLASSSIAPAGPSETPVSSVARGGESSATSEPPPPAASSGPTSYELPSLDGGSSGTVTSAEPLPPSLPAEPPADPEMVPQGSGAVMLAEAPEGDMNTSARVAGEVTWTRSTDELGRPTIAGRVTVPKRQISVDLVIRQSAHDPALPTRELLVKANPPPGFKGGEVAELVAVRLKGGLLTKGTPLAGTTRKLGSNSFEMALAPAEEDAFVNDQLLHGGRFIELSFVYATGRHASLVVGKDEATMALFDNVLNSWGAPSRQTAAAADAAAPVSGPYVQLFVSSSRAGAEQIVANLSAAFSAELNGHQLVVVEDTDAGGGTVYKVRSAVKSSTEGRFLCAALLKAGADCIVGGD